MAKQVVRLGIFVLALLLFGACAEADTEAVTPSLPPPDTSEITSTPTPPPRSTSTLTLTATARPTSTPAVADFRLLADLIWLRTNLGEIWRWQTDSPTAECLVGVSHPCLITVPEPIIDFDYQNGKILVSLASSYDPEIGITYQLGIVDLAQKNYQMLVEEQRTKNWPGTPFEEIALAPDASAAAYSFGLADYENLRFMQSYFEDFEIYHIDLKDLLEPKLIGACRYLENQGLCRIEVQWSPDSRHILWHGNGGLWIYEPGSDPELLIADSIDIENETNNIRYYPRSWSPNEEYLLIYEGRWESSNQSVLELQTRQKMYIPPAYSAYGAPAYSLIWTKEDEILLVQSRFEYEEYANQIHMYTYAARSSAGDEWLIEKDHQTFPYGYVNWVFSLLEKPDGDVLFLLWHHSMKESSSNPQLLLAQYVASTNELAILNQMTTIRKDWWAPSSFYWLKDGSAVLLEVENNLFYLTADGSESESLNFILGSHTCCFQWVEDE